MTQVEVVADVHTTTTTFVINTIRRVLYRFVKLRGLPPDYLIGVDQVVREALEIWVGEQSLEAIQIEVHRAGQGVERFFVPVTYDAEEQEEAVEPDLDALGRACAKRPALPPDVGYRLMAHLKEGHTRIPGWTPSAPYPLHVDFREELPSWGKGTVRMQAVYEGRQQVDGPDGVQPEQE